MPSAAPAENSISCVLIPQISFEVDRVEQSDRWESVVAEGTFEEVTDADEIQMAVALLERATGVPVVMGAHSVVFRLAHFDNVGPLRATGVMLRVLDPVDRRFPLSS